MDKTKVAPTLTCPACGALLAKATRVALRMRLSGETYVGIAAALGLSKDRAKRIVVKEAKRRDVTLDVYHPGNGFDAAELKAMKEMWQEGMTIKEIARATKRSFPSVNAYISRQRGSFPYRNRGYSE